MTKKTDSATGRADTSAAQSKTNEVYTAHQVHTLAHLIFRQIAAGWGARPWTSPGAAAVTSPMPGHAHAPGWPAGGTAPQSGAPQPMVYWYP